MCGDDDDDGIFAVKQKSYEKVSLKIFYRIFFCSRKFQVCENIYVIILFFIEITATLPLCLFEIFRV